MTAAGKGRKSGGEISGRRETQPDLPAKDRPSSLTEKRAFGMAGERMQD
jgi:hypothetical protein